MKHLIYKKLEDGSYGDKLGSYEGSKDDSSANRSYLMAEPQASHFLLPDGADEDCVDLVLVPEVVAQEAVGVEGEEGYIPAVEAVPAYYELQVNAQKVADKSERLADEAVAATLSWAKSVGEEIMNDFTKENMKMGITQDDMTGAVLSAMSKVILAMQTGSLKEAIKEAKLISAGSKDAKYVTDARLLSFVNKIETKLNIALSVSL